MLVRAYSSPKQNSERLSRRITFRRDPENKEANISSRAEIALKTR
jgi:hypothetical protein